MRITNRADGYGWLSIAMHWIIALAVIGLFFVGIWMVGLDYYSTWYHQAPFYHKSIGVLVVILMALRLLWSLTNPKPAMLGQNHKMNVVAKSVHGFLYLLVFGLGVSGYMISTADNHAISVFDLFSVPAFTPSFEGQADLAGLVHEWIAYVLIALVVLHALGALKHHFINRDATLKRMLRVSSIDK